MKLQLKDNNPTSIKRVRHMFRRSSRRLNVTLRNGALYTMRYNPGLQPRTESQERSWSIFKEANRLATADFHDPRRRAYWHQRLKSQSRYKTARGLARAYYISLLKSRLSHLNADVHASTFLAVRSLKPILIADKAPSPPLRPGKTWQHYRNILYLRQSLRTISVRDAFT